MQTRLMLVWPLRRLPRVIFIALLLLLSWADVSRANGIPVQVFLDHVPLKATWEPASGARGVAVVSANDEKVRVMAQNLPTPPSGSSYYAWLERATGGFLPVGPLAYQSDGTASVDQSMPGLPYSENFSWVLITLENPDAVRSRPGPDVALAGRLPNAEALPLAGNEAPQLLPVTGGAGGGLSLPLLLGMALLGAGALWGVLRLRGRSSAPAPVRIPRRREEKRQ